ncbi:UNVERIFIED_CONTAM: hypothetical protein FKN15_016710 [Acipenser sinensis]
MEAVMMEETRARNRSGTKAVGARDLTRSDESDGEQEEELACATLSGSGVSSVRNDLGASAPSVLRRSVLQCSVPQMPWRPWDLGTLGASAPLVPQCCALLVLRHSGSQSLSAHGALGESSPSVLRHPLCLGTPKLNTLGAWCPSELDALGTSKLSVLRHPLCFGASLHSQTPLVLVLP